jgi:hypothetical protein
MCNVLHQIEMWHASVVYEGETMYAKSALIIFTIKYVFTFIFVTQITILKCFLTQIFDIRSVYEGETMYATVDTLTFSHKKRKLSATF